MDWCVAGPGAEPSAEGGAGGMRSVLMDWCVAGPGAEPSAEGGAGGMRSVLMDWVLQVQEQNRQLKEALGG